MADPTPDVAIIVYPSEAELRGGGTQMEPIRGNNIHLSSEYREALQAYTDAVMAKVVHGLGLPAGLIDSGRPIPDGVSLKDPFCLTADIPAERDDMAEVWRDIMGEELGGES